MTVIAVVGGHGQIAQHLHPLLLAAGHTPVALVRKDDQARSLEGRGVQTRMLDIEGQDASSFAEAFTGCDAVVFAAGGGPDGDPERKRTVDLEGSLKSIEGAQQAGVRRFVQISSIGVDDQLPDDIDDVWRVYVEAKRDADTALRESDLDWTIIRPGKLTDHEPTGLVELGPDVSRDEVSRADVAAVVAAVLVDDRAVSQQWNLVGGETPVGDAVSTAVGD